MLLTACSTSGTVPPEVELEASDSALCEGLKTPVDEFVEILLRRHKETPAEVINGGTKVVRGFDAECQS